MSRLLCTDGEGGGLGCETPDSLVWNIDKFGCCSKTLDITDDVWSPLLLVWLFRAFVILDHISWKLQVGTFASVRRPFSRKYVGTAKWPWRLVQRLSFIKLYRLTRRVGHVIEMRRVAGRRSPTDYILFTLPVVWPSLAGWWTTAFDVGTVWSAAGSSFTTPEEGSFTRKGFNVTDIEIPSESSWNKSLLTKDGLEGYPDVSNWLKMCIWTFLGTLHCW